MAEQQKPVIVDEEEQNVERTGLAIPLSTEEDDSKTVGEMIEAGEVALPKGEGTVEDLPKEKGIPRLDITPVRIQPRPEANVPSELQVVKTGDKLATVVGKSIPKVKAQFKSLQSDIEKEIEVQQKPSLSYDDAIKQLESGNPVSFETPQGTQTYIPEQLDAIRSSTMLQGTMRGHAAIAESLTKDKPAEEPVIGYTDPTRSKVNNARIQDPYSYEDTVDYATSRINLNNYIKEKGYVNTGDSQVDVAVRQVFIDQLPTGSFGMSLANRLAESGRGFVTLPQIGNEMVEGFGRSLGRSLKKGTPFWDEWAADAEEREANTKRYLETIDEYLPGPTAAMWLNGEIHKRFDKELEEGTITEAEHQRLTMEEGITGDLIKREFVDEQGAYDLIEFAFTELPALWQAGVIGSEFVLTGTAPAMSKSGAARDMVTDMIKFRQVYNVPKDVRLSGTAAWVNTETTMRKIDDNLFQIGLLNKQLRSQTERAKNRAKALNERIPSVRKEADAALERGDLTLHASLKKEADTLESEAKNLKRQAARNAISAALSPYTVEVVKDDLVLAGAAFTGSQLLAGFTGSREMGELSGMFLGMVANPVVVGPTGRFIGKLGKGFVHTTGMRSMVPAVMAKIMQMDTTVDDYLRINNIDASFKTRKAMNRAFKELEKMNPEQRAEMKRIVQQHLQLQEDIIKSFPQDKQEEARRLFDASFAELTGMAPLIGMYKQSSQGLTSKQIRKAGFRTVYDQMEDIQAQSIRAQAAINNLDNYIASYANPASKEEMRKLVQTATKGLDNIKAQLELEYNALDNQINIMLDAITGDSTMQIPENFVADAIQIQRELQKKINIPQKIPEDGVGPMPTVGQQRGQEVVEKAEEIDFISKKKARVFDNFQNRLSQVKSMRDDKVAHQQATARAAEAILEAQYSFLADIGDEAYRDFRTFVSSRGSNQPTIDITKFVEDMIRISDEKDIMRFFGPEATFFSGHLGKRAMKMFDSMVRRTLMDIGEDSLSEIIDSAKKTLPESEQAAFVAKANNLAEEDPIRFGVFLHKFGKVNVFSKATIEEAEELRRAFRDYSFKVTNDAVAAQYASAKDTIDELMEKSDPEGFEQLLAVREIYQSSKDPLRPGSLMQKLKTSKVGEKVDLDSGPFVGMYRNEDPYSILAKAGEHIGGILKGGARSSLDTNKLKNHMAGLEQAFGTHIGDNGQLYIDLDTEQGAEVFETLRQLTEEVVYSSWANKVLGQLPQPGTRMPVQRESFTTTLLEELDSITEQPLQINVKVGGEETTRAIIDVAGMIAEEQDIVKVIGEGEKYHQQGLKAVAEFKTLLKKVSNDARVGKGLEEASMRSIYQLTGLQSNLEFFEKYIQGNGDVSEVKRTFVRQLANDPALQGKDLNALFDEAAYKMVYGALKEKGGYRATQLKKTAKYQELVLEAGGENAVIKEFTNTLGLIEALQDPSIIRNLNKVGIDETHVKHLEMITTYISTKQAMNLAADASARGMNANEVLSRAYNIAREMVSPTYIASELAVRILKKADSDSFLLMLQNKEAAKIMEKMMYFPERVRPGEMNTFETLVLQFAATQVVAKGQREEITSFLNDAVGVTDEEQEE